MITEYGYVGLFFLFGIGFVASAFVISWLLRPRAPSRMKNSPYECGEVVKGDSWIQFNVQYYLIAFTFVIFDIEALFIIPWAVVLRNLGAPAYYEMLIFVLILAVGLVYAWKKGALEWQ